MGPIGLRCREFVYFVLYHGDGPWTAPAHVTDLFRCSDPGRYRLVPWKEGEGDDRSPDDLAALVLGLARHLSPEDMATGSCPSCSMVYLIPTVSTGSPTR